MILNDDLLGRIRAAIDLPGKPDAIRLVCAMSGGVDSSVVAGLAKLAGYDVVGITLQLYDHGQASRSSKACCAGQDIHDARRVAAKLGIPHYVLDFESRFREAVIDDFADSYLRGETPVPCIRCNQTVKFADLMARAKDLGAAALLTGHYVESRARGDAFGHRDLLSATDTSRDQSYFLFATTQAQIDFLRFPLASLTKPETRQIASELGLGVAEKPDSQDICFVPHGRYADVIARLRPEATQSGEIVHVDGRRLGNHAGILNFTVGQRRGLGVAEGAPLYVTGIDAPRRRVIVGPREALAESDMFLNEVNWLGEAPLDLEPLTLYARIRSTRAPVAAEVAMAEQGVRVRLKAAEYGVSPGQACVLYERPGAGARVLGGGFIASRRKPALQESALAVT